MTSLSIEVLDGIPSDLTLDAAIQSLKGKPSDLQVTGRWKWPKSADGLVRVPYKIPSGLSKARRGDIAQTVKEFKDKTCIRYYTLHQKRVWATNDKAKFLS